MLKKTILSQKSTLFSKARLTCGIIAEGLLTGDEVRFSNAA